MFFLTRATVAPLTLERPAPSTSWQGVRTNVFTRTTSTQKWQSAKGLGIYAPTPIRISVLLN